MTLKMDNFGRVLIPKMLRQMLRIEPGGEIFIEINTDKLELLLKPMPATRKDGLTFTSQGLPVLTGGDPFPTDYDTVADIKNDYSQYHSSRFGA